MELNLFSSDPESVVEDEEEPSVITYAREQGICIDYTTELPQLVDICLSLQETFTQDLCDPFHDDLTNAANAAAELTKQRLTITKDVALLLKSVLALREPLPDDPLETDRRQCILDMKQELPVMQTDAELDMLSFGTRFEPDFKDLRTRLPSEDLDEENDEGFGWPAKYFAYPAQWDAKIKGEKLAVTRGDLTFLHSAVRDDFTPEDHELILKEELEGRRDLILRHLTPPLLPLSPPLMPYIPSSPANHLPLAPESSDPVAAEARVLEQHIMAQDSLIRHGSGSSDSMLLDVPDLDVLLGTEEANSPHFSDHLPTILKRRADDLKVEGPLTPPILSDSPMKKLKSVSFAKMIQLDDTFEPWNEVHRPSTAESHSITDTLLKELGSLADEANRKVENERLTGADTVARVEVPVIDFALPVAPWDEYSKRRSSKNLSGFTELEAQMRFLQLVKRDDLKTATAWRGISDLDLRWGWFASPSSSIKLNEELHGENEFNKIQADLKQASIATSSNEVWKKDGLQILEEKEDDEEEEDLELAEAEAEEWNDMEALIRKRKLEMDDQEAVLEPQRKQKAAGTSQPLRGSRPRPEHGVRSQQSTWPTSRLASASKSKDAPSELMFGSFSASTALHKFMETQGRAIKATKPLEQDSLATLPRTIPVTSREQSAKTSVSFGQGPGQTVHDNNREQTTHFMPEPPTPLNLPACSFIVSTSLLQRRTLMKQVDRLYPNAELIYRDYALPHCPSPEADILLSPSTGLVLTTLQQIKQLPLPGQKLRSPVKERISHLQSRYERLILLISEGLREDSAPSRPEDARDKDTLAGLEVFAAQLEADVAVQYVRGGEAALAQTIAECMGAHGLPSGGMDMGDIKLFAVETTWEVFLRRAGLNPFAAQVIIASLKIPTIMPLPALASSPADYEPQRTVQVFGLPRFVLMGVEERGRAFQALLGGRRVLDRVGALLDQRWVSAAHGFRM